MKTSRSYYAVGREGINLLPLSWEDVLREKFGNRNKRSPQILQCHLGDLLSATDRRGKNLPVGGGSRRDLGQSAYFTHLLGEEESRHCHCPETRHDIPAC